MVSAEIERRIHRFSLGHPFRCTFAERVDPLIQSAAKKEKPPDPAAFSIKIVDQNLLQVLFEPFYIALHRGELHFGLRRAVRLPRQYYHPHGNALLFQSIVKLESL